MFNSKDNLEKEILYFRMKTQATIANIRMRGCWEQAGPKHGGEEWGLGPSSAAQCPSRYRLSLPKARLSSHCDEAVRALLPSPYSCFSSVNDPNVLAGSSGKHSSRCLMIRSCSRVREGVRAWAVQTCLSGGRAPSAAWK